MSRQPLASLLLIDSTPQSNETCLLTFMFGEMVRIFTEGLNSETYLADFPELEKTIIAFISGL